MASPPGEPQPVITVENMGRIVNWPDGRTFLMPDFVAPDEVELYRSGMQKLKRVLDDYGVYSSISKEFPPLQPNCVDSEYFMDTVKADIERWGDFTRFEELTTALLPIFDSLGFGWEGVKYYMDVRGEKALNRVEDATLCTQFDKWVREGKYYYAMELASMAKRLNFEDEVFFDWNERYDQSVAYLASDCLRMLEYNNEDESQHYRAPHEMTLADRGKMPFTGSNVYHALWQFLVTPTHNRVFKRIVLNDDEDFSLYREVLLEFCLMIEEVQEGEGLCIAEGDFVELFGVDENTARAMFTVYKIELLKHE